MTISLEPIYGAVFHDLKLPAGYRFKIAEILPLRLHSKIGEPTESGCWPWKACTHKGYGQIWWNKKMSPAHRVVYQLLRGAIPNGLVPDHLCRNRACVNPWHLEPVTFRENVLRGIGTTAENAKKTHCKRNHPFNSENTYCRIDKKGRECRACKALAKISYRNLRNDVLGKERYLNGK